VFPRNAQSDATTIPNSNSFVLMPAKKVSQDGSVASELNNSKKSADNIALNKNRTLFGIASFYSFNLEGTETATGETFYHEGFTAASNNFKLNTLVKVTNLRNGKSVIVRINDRMHPKMAKKGRIVDLTLSAAKKIGLSFLTGLTKVKVEPLALK